MSIEERVRALLESLQAGRVCVEVDDVTGNDPTSISASMEMIEGSVWRVLDHALYDEDAVEVVEEFVRCEVRNARARYQQAILDATRAKREADRMIAALAAGRP